jgi:hypothetical protein
MSTQVSPVSKAQASLKSLMLDNESLPSHLIKPLDRVRPAKIYQRQSSSASSAKSVDASVTPSAKRVRFNDNVKVHVTEAMDKALYPILFYSSEDVWKFTNEEATRQTDKLRKEYNKTLRKRSKSFESANSSSSASPKRSTVDRSSSDSYLDAAIVKEVSVTALDKETSRKTSKKVDRLVRSSKSKQDFSAKSFKTLPKKLIDPRALPPRPVVDTKLSTGSFFLCNSIEVMESGPRQPNIQHPKAA